MSNITFVLILLVQPSSSPSVEVFANYCWSGPTLDIVMRWDSNLTPDQTWGILQSAWPAASCLITRGCFNGSTDQHNLMLPFSLANTEISTGDKSGLVNAPTTQCTRFKILTLNLLCFKGLNGYLK